MESIRNRFGRVFSRQVMGTVFVAVAVEHAVGALVDVALGTTSPLRIGIWIGFWVASVVGFVWWDAIASRTTEAADGATDRLDVVSDVADEIAREVAEEIRLSTAENGARDGGGDAGPRSIGARRLPGQTEVHDGDAGAAGSRDPSNRSADGSSGSSGP